MPGGHSTWCGVLGNAWKSEDTLHGEGCGHGGPGQEVSLVEKCQV